MKKNAEGKESTWELLETASDVNGNKTLSLCYLWNLLKKFPDYEFGNLLLPLSKSNKNVNIFFFFPCFSSLMVNN